MNDTNASTEASVRYDSAEAATTSGDDRHAIQTYLSDVLALERHIAQPLERQLAMDDTARFGEVAAIIASLKSLTDAHIANLVAALEAAGGHAASPVKSAWAQLLGTAAAAIDGARKTKVSKNLRDDYTALSLATASYTMLNATALGLGEGAIAQLAKRHLEDDAQMLMRIFRALPAVVLEELAIDGENVRVTAAEISQQTTLDVWK